MLIKNADEKRDWQYNREWETEEANSWRQQEESTGQVDKLVFNENSEIFLFVTRIKKLASSRFINVVREFKDVCVLGLFFLMMYEENH